MGLNDLKVYDKFAKQIEKSKTELDGFPYSRSPKKGRKFLSTAPPPAAWLFCNTQE